MNRVIIECEDKMKKVIASFQTDLSGIRAGRANPNVLNRISVSYYGAMTPITQVGNINVPEPRILQIQPWDISILNDVEKAILASDLGITPSNDGKCIRLVFPELTEERRQSLTKDVKKKGEDYKVSVRNIRREVLDRLKKMEKTSEISRDELESLESKIQKATDSHIANIETIVIEKNKDILSI